MHAATLAERRNRGNVAARDLVAQHVDTHTISDDQQQRTLERVRRRVRVHVWIDR